MNVNEWAEVVNSFEDLCLSKGLDNFDESTMTELLTGLLSGKALGAYRYWFRKESEMLTNYQRLKREFPSKLGVAKD